MPYARRVPHVTEKGYSIPPLLHYCITLQHLLTPHQLRGSTLVPQAHKDRSPQMLEKTKSSVITTRISL